MIDGPIVTLHAKVLENELGTLLDQHVVKALEVKLVQSRLLHDQTYLGFVKLRREVSYEQCELLAKGNR